VNQETAVAVSEGDVEIACMINASEENTWAGEAASGTWYAISIPQRSA